MPGCCRLPPAAPLPRMAPDRQPILLAGPTASGKSALAVALAERLDGLVINADSQQIYADWRVLTARPTPAEEARVSHRLYGFLGLDMAYSVGQWLRDLAPCLAEAEAAGRVAIVTGGTGLYFTALTEGLAEIPPVPAALRADIAERLDRDGLPALVEGLAAADPDTAATIDHANPARILRAWEVLRATGRGLAAWQADTPPPLLPPSTARCLALMPDPGTLDARIAQRFVAMVAGGALEEAAAVAARDPASGAPGMKALGAWDLVEHLRGERSLEDAVARATQVTRRYAKRQRTWIRGRLPDWPRLADADPEIALAALAHDPIA
ncbi:MAG: tRNA (adenosine(37)-N6)-dimethylallyltransferase MiaA [Pseudomonadota bacterium]